MKFILLLWFISTASSTVNYKLEHLDSPIATLLWCGSSVVYTRDDETVELTENQSTRMILFSLSDHGTVYKSSDYGMTWINVN